MDKLVNILNTSIKDVLIKYKTDRQLKVYLIALN